MNLPLLQTKSYVPPSRPEWVSRPHLIERLNGGLGRKLTLVSAPAGFGKTSLLAEWVRDIGATQATAQRCAWLSLDQGDSDWPIFAAYLLSALQMVHPRVGETALAALRSPQPPPLEAVLTTLINEISEPAEGPRFILVLDDYHLIESPAVHQARAFLLEHLPPRLHLVVASRTDPPLPLGRLRGQGQLNELRMRDLRFTLEEAGTFLNQVMGLDLSAENVASLEARTEGWIVGLQLAALSMQGRRDVNAFIQTFSGSHRFVLDYLIEEVLERQPPEIQSFLLATSVLERMSASLCDALLGIGDAPPFAREPMGTSFHSQAALEHLDQANLFLVPLDDERRWFRYHHLFASLLRNRLEQAMPEQVPVLQRRASVWYEQRGLIAEAIGYALAAGDAGRVARLIAGNALAMMEHGELRRLEQRLGDLPREMLRARPWLCIAHAWMLAFTGQLQAVEPLLLRAQELTVEAEHSEPTAVTGPVQFQAVRGHVAAIRTYVAGVTGNPRQGIDFAREAQEHLPADDVTTRAWIAVSMALYLYRVGDVAAADQALAKAVTISRTTGNSYVAVMALCNLAVAQIQQGRLRQAAETFQEALRRAEAYAEQAGQKLPVSGYAYTHLAGILCEWNDLQSAMRYVQEGMELCRQWGEPQLLVGGCMVLAVVLASRGDINGALEAVQEAKGAASHLSAVYVGRVAPLEALLLLQQGDLPGASRWAAAAPTAAADYFDIFEYWSADLVRARIILAQGRTAEALTVLGRVQEAAAAAGAGEYLIRALILRSLALQQQGQSERALDALGRALVLAEPEGFVRAFIGEGPAIEPLLQQAAARGVALDYVRDLLAALERPDSLIEGLVEPLSERELEVLRLLAAGLSNREIAELLVLAVGTVKKYTSNLYGKLGVGSRTQAVARARELGIL